MAEDVYAVPDLTKKVRYRREREQETEDRGEREERVVDIYVSVDDLDLGRGRGPDPATQQVAVQQNTTQQQHGASDESRKKNAFKAATVCLGVLCVILLAGITGLGVHNSDLIEKNNNLTKDQDHLQSKYDILNKYLDQMTNQKDDLQFRYDNVTAERDELKKRLCDPGWQIFGCSCYFISTERKTWEESNKYCIDNQSDLIIINSKEEQDFVNRVVNLYQKVWLGLTDREEEGVWKWVDGTPLTSPTYWSSGQPDDLGGGEDCAEHCWSTSGWFDQPCTWPNRWICEKALW